LSIFEGHVRAHSPRQVESRLLFSPDPHLALRVTFPQATVQQRCQLLSH